MSSTFNVDRIHELSTKTLIYFTGADVNIYVNWVAMTMFRDFKLSIAGQRDISACLSNLPAIECAAVDDRLTLGWGSDNFIHQPGMHQYGYEHMTVMVALASIFHEAYAAEVCHAYASSAATGDDDMLPHLRQWKNHLRSLCGVFATSTFPQLVETYIRLDPYCVGPGSNLLAKRCRVQPRAMADGLRALSEVIAGTRKQVTLVGGAVVGWYAAFAEFYYGLRPVILTRTGERLHGQSDETTQLVLVYHQDPDLEVFDDWSEVQRDDRDGDTNDKDENPFWSKHVHYLPFGGRVQWNSLLPEVFGRAFWVFEHEESKTLADLVGSAARSLEGEDGQTNDDNDSFSGADLIQSLAGWLPELRRGQARMERHLRQSVAEARELYRSTVEHLTRRCNCNVCSRTGKASAPKDGYCLTSLAETVVVLGLAVSRMTVVPGICPAREGVQALYARQALARSSSSPSSSSFTSVLYASEYRASVSIRLQNAIELMSGTRPETDCPPDGLVAVVHEGACAYLEHFFVNNKNKQEGKDRGMIGVTSGAVCLGQKVFTRVCDRQPVVVQEGEEGSGSGGGSSGGSGGREGLPWEEIRRRDGEKDGNGDGAVCYYYCK